MKKIHILFIFVLFCFPFTHNFAQTEMGYVHLKIYNAKNPLCKIDDSLAFNFNNAMLTLSPGKHNIKIWMPLTTLIDTSIYVKQHDTVEYIFKVKTAPKYSKYLIDYSNYKQIKKQRLFISPVLIGASLGVALFANGKSNSYMNEALLNRERYSNTGSQKIMDENEALFKENKKNYKKYAGLEIGMYSVAGILTVNYIRLILKQHRTLAPIYKEENLLSQLMLNAYPDIAAKKIFLGISMKF